MHIPLDAWATIMLFVDEQNLISTFDTIYSSGAINISEGERLNTFWTLMSLAKLKMNEKNVQKPSFSLDSSYHVETFRKLREMGVHSEKAYSVIRQTDGTLDGAFELLGWYAA